MGSGSAWICSWHFCDSSVKVSISGARGSASSELFVMGSGGVGQNHRAGDVPSGMGYKKGIRVGPGSGSG